jgi:hypothetical protein
MSPLWAGDGMKTALYSLLILLAFTVYFKPTAYYKGGVMTGLKEPQKIELKEITVGEAYGIHGITKEGKKVFIPWDSIAWIEETCGEK